MSFHEVRGGAVRSEAEEIQRTMCDGNILDKVRHYVSHAGMIWHVDVYDGLLSGVILAEVELQDANQELELPTWIGGRSRTIPHTEKSICSLSVSQPCAKRRLRHKIQPIEIRGSVSS